MNSGLLPILDPSNLTSKIARGNYIGISQVLRSFPEQGSPISWEALRLTCSKL
jgi:hypothetical protein